MKRFFVLMAALLAAGFLILASWVISGAAQAVEDQERANEESAAGASLLRISSENNPPEAPNDITDADLTVTKSDTPAPVYAGENLTYSIHVSNAGPATATSVVLTDILPGGVTLVSAPPGCLGDPTIVCNLGDIQMRRYARPYLGGISVGSLLAAYYYIVRRELLYRLGQGVQL